MKQSYLTALAVVVLIGGFIGYQMWGQREATPTPAPVAEDGSHVITLTKDGFVPADITIAVGETVTFRNETGMLFWPASNLHPSHLIYAEFDPKEPLQAEESWSFTFTKAGEWEYHDHLAPYYTGVITVTE